MKKKDPSSSFSLWSRVGNIKSNMGIIVSPNTVRLVKVMAAVAITFITMILIGTSIHFMTRDLKVTQLVVHKFESEDQNARCFGFIDSQFKKKYASNALGSDTLFVFECTTRQSIGSKGNNTNHTSDSLQVYGLIYMRCISGTWMFLKFEEDTGLWYYVNSLVIPTSVELCNSKRLINEVNNDTTEIGNIGNWTDWRVNDYALFNGFVYPGSQNDCTYCEATQILRGNNVIRPLEKWNSKMCKDTSFQPKRYPRGTYEIGRQLWLCNGNGTWVLLTTGKAM